MTNYEKLRRQCVIPEMFERWTPQKTLKAMRETIANDPKDTKWALDNILNPGFPREIAERKQAAGKWSYGYCYYIAEVATLIFDAIHLRYQRLFVKQDSVDYLPDER